MMTTPEQWVAKLGNRIERQRFASQPALLKELIEQVQRDAAAELDALQRNNVQAIETIKDCHKLVASLRTQNRELREAAKKVERLDRACGAVGAADILSKALAATEVNP